MQVVVCTVVIDHVLLRRRGGNISIILGRQIGGGVGEGLGAIAPQISLNNGYRSKVDLF